jgi:predicted lipoprotein with Yx(FWY)xxD motif
VIAVVLASAALAGPAGGAVTGTAATANAATVVKVAYNAKLHQKILVDGRGLTLYMYAGDYKTTSGCSTQYNCLSIWPPLVVAPGTKPKAGAGVRASLLSTAKQKDGRVQVLYAGHLLYTFHNTVGQPPPDKPGDINGFDFLQNWWPLTPAGKVITKK